MKDSKKLLLSVFGILSAVLLTTAASYALFSYSRTGLTENTIQSGSIKFHYQEASQGLTLNDAMPMTDAQGEAQTTYFDFTITSQTSSEIKVPYYITARRKGNDNSLDSSVRVYLTEVTNKGEQNESENALTLENNQQVSKFSQLSTYTNTTLNITAAKNEKVLYTSEVPKNTANYTKDYRLRMWVDDSATYSQTETGSCSDSTITTKEACIAGGEDWTVTATSVQKEFTVTVNVYAEGESDVTPAVDPYAIGTKFTLDPGDGTPRDFYILSVDNSTNKVRLIMDRNITQGTATTTMTYADAMAYFNSGTGLAIKNSWTNVESIDLPGAQELTEIFPTSNPGWWVNSKDQCETIFDGEEYAWVYNYTKDCGIGDNYAVCDSNAILSSPEASGYWTKDLVSDDNNYAWYIDGQYASLYYDDITDSIYNGVRPVITVSKTALSN